MTRTGKQYGPPGFDGNPIEGMVALYTRTEVDGAEVFIGWLNRDCLSEPGEARVFSTDADGNFKFTMWLRADGTVLIGDSKIPAAYVNFAVKYNELKTEYDKTKLYLTTLRTATGAIATALDAFIPGTSAAFNAAMVGQVVGDIASSKNEKIKTP